MVFSGFVPHRLEIKEFPQLNKFPFNVLFIDYAVKYGKQITGTALYEPEFYTYGNEGHLSIMRYRNVYGGNCHLFIVYDDKNKRYRGEKFINDKSVGSADGSDDWHKFFIHFTILGLVPGERCKFENT